MKKLNTIEFSEYEYLIDLYLNNGSWACKNEDGKLVTTYKNFTGLEELDALHKKNRGADFNFSKIKDIKKENLPKEFEYIYW